MDTDDQIDIVDALLAIHSALQKLATKLPPDEFIALQDDTRTILNVCRKMIDRRKAKLPPGLLGGIVTGGGKNGL